MKEDKPKLPLLHRLAAISVSTMVALAIGEVVLRVHAHRTDGATLQEALADESVPEPGGKIWLRDILRLSGNDRIVYELKPNLPSVQLTNPSMTVSTNELGLQGDVPSPDRAGTELRVAGIGDSVMFGWGVPVGTDFLSILEESLEEGEGPHWAVLNSGVPGYNTVMEVETLRERLLVHEPDLVVLSLVANDISLPSFIHERPDHFALRHSYVADLLLRRFGVVEAAEGDMQGMDVLQVAPHDDVTERAFEDDPDKVPEAYRHMVGWEAFENALDELAAMAKEEGFEVLAFTFERLEKCERMRAEAEERGFLTLDVFQRFRAYLEAKGTPGFYRSELVLSPTDPHPSEIGHRMIAEALEEALRDSGMLERLLARSASR